jgi:glycosyltransferase involved in cell wall biosynthesis
VNPASSAASAAPIPSKTGPGVTVVVPSFNHARYLRDAVRSVVGQGYRPLEVLVVDDGSTDSTPALVRALEPEFPELRCIRQANAGLSAARNTGILNARYPFVSFLDADDEWQPEMLETLMREFATQPDSVPAVACNSYRMDSSGQPTGEKKLVQRGNRYFTAADILMKTRFTACCVVARRSAFDSAGMFDTSLKSSEDRDMWLRLASAGAPIWYTDAALVRIRRHDSNMSRNTGRMRNAMRRVRRKAWAAGSVPRRRAGYWLRCLAVDHFSGAWMYWDEGRPAKALFHSLLSLALWPLPLDYRDLNEPPFFRMRAAARFLIFGFLRKGHG